nr:oxidoreductase [Actinomycetota bacterium]
MRDGHSGPVSWTDEDVPPQTGRTALVTGASSGLGLASTVALARVGARVLMAVR